MTQRLLLRRVVPVAAACGALLALFVVVGRWERRHNAHVQNARIEAVYRAATSRGLISPLLDYYRFAATFDCLLYHSPGHPDQFSDFELCFDAQGRLIEAIDRRGGNPVIGTLREEPRLAAITVPVPRLLAALTHLGAQRDPRLGGVGLGGGLPLGFPDYGLHHYLPAKRAGSSS